MIRMHRYPDGTDGLAAFCDVCGEQIREHGFVVWNGDDPNDWLVIHQARCDPGNAAGYDCSMGLEAEVIYLANSAKIDLDKARETVGALASIG